MGKGPTAFLQVVVVLIGAGALFLLLWEPHIEGRNANATVFEIYFRDPFLAYAYVASIPFFVGVYQVFKVLGYAGQSQLLSPDAVKAVRTVKYCALAIIAFVVGGEIYIITRITDDDRAGGVVIGLFIILCSIIVATAAAVIERALQRRAVGDAAG